MDKTKPYIDLGAKLRGLRGGISVDVFADKLGVSTRTYYRYESGERKIKKAHMRIAELESAAASGHDQMAHEEQSLPANAVQEHYLDSGFKMGSAECLAMGQLYELLKRGNDIIKRAILANLDAFSTTIDASAEVADLRQRLSAMEQQLSRQGLVVIDRRIGEDRRKHDEPHAGEERRAGGDRRKQGAGT